LNIAGALPFTIAPGIAPAILAIGGGSYGVPYTVAGFSAVFGAFAILPVVLSMPSGRAARTGASPSTSSRPTRTIRWSLRRRYPPSYRKGADHTLSALRSICVVQQLRRPGTDLPLSLIFNPCAVVGR
jgi:hypothetical protein